MLRSIGSRLSYANVVATLALVVALAGGAYAASTLPPNSVGAAQLQAGSVRSRQIRDGAIQLGDIGAGTRSKLRGARGFARIRVTGVLGGGPYYTMALVGPRRGFLSARSPAGGTTCLKPDPKVFSLADVQGGVMTDESGNDTRAYFDGSFGCNSNEVRVVQKFNFDGSATNQNFNIVVP
jgi:hypothetical protein